MMMNHDDDDCHIFVLQIFVGFAIRTSNKKSQFNEFMNNFALQIAMRHHLAQIL